MIINAQGNNTITYVLYMYLPLCIYLPSFMFNRVYLSSTISIEMYTRNTLLGTYLIYCEFPRIFYYNVWTEQ